MPAGAEVPGCEEPPAEELEFEEPDELEEAPEEEELEPEPAFEDGLPPEDEEEPEPESEDPLESELSDDDPSPFDFDSSLPEASLDASFLSSDSLSAALVSFDASSLSAFAWSEPSADAATIPTLSAALTTGESAGRPKPFVKANAEAPMNNTDTTARAAMPARVAKESDVRFGGMPEGAV